jgi:hypothetical protein
MKDAIDILADDVELANRNLKEDGTGYNRRAYIRALFSYIEGLSYFLRQEAKKILLIKKRRFGLTEKEEEYLFLLEEKVHLIGKNGSIMKKPGRLGTLSAAQCTEVLMILIRRNTAFGLFRPT